MEKNGANPQEKVVHITRETIQDIDESSEIESMRKIEAALFLSARFLSLKELVLLTDTNPLMVKELLEKISQRYVQEYSALEIIHKDDIWKMDVKKEYFNLINKLATGSAEFTKAEAETLAVIAYKQPVKQSVIIKIRGNKAYTHIKKFIETGLLLAKKIGHTNELKLSEEFFDYFHLQGKNLKEHGLLSDEIDDEEEDENKLEAPRDSQENG